MNEDGHGVTGEQAAGRGMSDADAHGEETGEVVEGASRDSATLASAFEAAVREDRRDTDYPRHFDCESNFRKKHNSYGNECTELLR